MRYILVGIDTRDMSNEGLPDPPRAQPAQRSYFIGRSRRMLQRAVGAAAPLGMERGLLRRILTRLLPRTLADLPRHPRLAGRRLALITVSLTFLALGYLSCVSP